MKGHRAASLRPRVSSNAAVLSNRLARAEDPALLSWNYSETPAPLDYAGRWSPWSWHSQLDIRFQLANVRLAAPGYVPGGERTDCR